jgi:hypothetical protein
MSDIYLQITETPTVVTLSAPVVSGALASTVTVANTVTVALDSNSLSALENVTVTVGAAITGTVTVGNFPSSQAVTFSAVTISNLPATQTIAGTVTANAGNGYETVIQNGIANFVGEYDALPISGTVTANLSNTVTATYKTAIGGVNAVPFVFAKEGANGGEILGYDGANTSLNVNIKGSLPSLVAGTAQIGSVTASISGTVPISISSVTVGNSVTIGSFATSVTARLINPAGTAVTYAEVGTAGNPSIDVLSVQGVTSGTPLTILNHQGTTVTTSNFTSTTASTVLASFNATREVLTIFNEGAGNLHICAGATCTTIAYQVRLSAGDYYEVPNHQTTITHSAVFATAGTARVVQIS